eukprot:1386983-Rhodomonas_salina.2
MRLATQGALRVSGPAPATTIKIDARGSYQATMPGSERGAISVSARHHKKIHRTMRKMLPRASMASLVGAKSV